MLRLLVDMNLSPSWIPFLQDSGFEAVHWSAIGAQDAEDAILMRWAEENHHVVLTADLDFSAILAATGRRSPSVVQIRDDLLTPAAIGTTVLTAVQQARDELAAGAVVSVSAARARMRLLPFGGRG